MLTPLDHMNVCVGGCTLPEAWLAAMGKMEASLGTCNTTGWSLGAQCFGLSMARPPNSLSCLYFLGDTSDGDTSHPSPQEGVLVTTDWTS